MTTTEFEPLVLSFAYLAMQRVLVPGISVNSTTPEAPTVMQYGRKTDPSA